MSRIIAVALFVIVMCSPALAQQYVEVFVTSDSFDGNFGGIGNANSACTTAALDAGLSGGWTAWLSTSATDAVENILDSQYRLIDGTIVANSLADLTSGIISAPIDLDETGTVVDAGFVWTGTLPTGSVSPNEHCDDWTSNGDAIGAIGTTDEIDGQWTFTGDSSCGSIRRLYCFADAEVPVELQEFSVE